MDAHIRLVSRHVVELAGKQPLCCLRRTRQGAREDPVLETNKTPNLANLNADDEILSGGASTGTPETAGDTDETEQEDEGGGEDAPDEPPAEEEQKG